MAVNHETAGLNPRKCGIVVAKSPTAFRADYDPFVAGTYIADSPGCATPDWSRLKFENFMSPLWPLQQFARVDDAEWMQNEKPLVHRHSSKQGLSESGF